jgi:putative SOS response-associated peptidase YedK
MRGFDTRLMGLLMCGRARLPTDYSEIKIKLKLGPRSPALNLRPSWNIAPTQDMLCVLRDPATGERVSHLMRWGLIPSWAKDEKMKYATFNAKAETIDTTASFRGAWKAGRRCLVVTDGFYEWRKGDKQPFAIARRKGELTVMAGLWEEWKSPSGEVIKSCTVITTNANDLIAKLHDRMPVILAEKDWPAWLGEVPATPQELKALLAPFPSEEMELWPVDKRVGNVRNNDPGLVAPVRSEGDRAAT